MLEISRENVYLNFGSFREIFFIRPPFLFIYNFICMYIGFMLIVVDSD